MENGKLDGKLLMHCTLAQTQNSTQNSKMLITEKYRINVKCASENEKASSDRAHKFPKALQFT